MFTQPETSPLVQGFIDFVRSGEARAILEDNGDIQISGKTGQ